MALEWVRTTKMRDVSLAHAAFDSPEEAEVEDGPPIVLAIQYWPHSASHTVLAT